MTPQDVLDQVIHETSEYLEMTQNPGEFVAWALAHKIIQMHEYIKYLEKRVEHDCRK